MKQSFRSIFPILAAGLLVVGLLWIWVSIVDPALATAEVIQAPQTGFLAPNVVLTNEAGETVALSDYRGQAVLLNLWASWCGPCRAEMPAMEQIFQDLQSEGFIVLAVNATNQDSQAAALRFRDEHNLTFPILFDTAGSASLAYRLQALPSSYFIDKDGIIQEVVIGGPMAEALLRTRVEALLTE